MIRHQGNFMPVKNRAPDFIKLFDGRRTRNIIGQHQIYL